MKNQIFSTIFLLIITSIIYSCQTEPRSDLEAQINDVEKQLFETKNGVINKKEAANIIHLYTKYVNDYPEDEKSPQYLFKAADVSINSFHSDATIELFDRIITEYPHFEKTPQALFLKAFTYENYLMNLDSARVSYLLFLDKYPNHNFANDAQVSLNNLGKSPEEIIKSFNQSNP
jgi:outer membrane protein assembly factor BamD (BamD/ComL family)